MVITTDKIGRFLRGIKPKMAKLTYKKPKMAKVSTLKMSSIRVPRFPAHVQKLVAKTPKFKVPKVRAK